MKVTQFARQGSAAPGKAGRRSRCRAIGEEAQRSISAIATIAAWGPQTPGALRVAAARYHLHRCLSSAMARIACVQAPGIWPRDARNAGYVTFTTAS